MRYLVKHALIASYLRASMSAKFDYNGHTLEIINVQGKPGFYDIQVDGRSSKVVLSASEMIDRVRQATPDR